MLPYGRQSISEDDIQAVVNVLRGDFLTTGPAVGIFEEALAKFIGVKHAVACANGTAALHLASLALGLKPGDQVIVPSISFVATANGPRYVGAEIIFADVDPDTALITPAALEAAIARADPKRLKAVFVVHMGGHPVPMAEIAAIARARGLKIVEDACHALGTESSESEPWSVGDCTYSDLAVFSFHPVKTITTGEGGAITTNDDRMARQMRLERNHGLEREREGFGNAALAFDADGATNPWYHELRTLGLNYRLTDFQAALGLSQLGRLPEFLERRRALTARYREQFAKLNSDTLRLVEAPKGSNSALHLMVALVDFDGIGISRAKFMNRLRERGVGTQVHYIPIHRQPYYVEASASPDLPGADGYYARCLSLPLYPDMTEADVDKVVETLQAVAAG
ncbi:UDP-4-amino-4,6-dideoxy-N-acetyl-beta-L-altrosamine transaminase [Mesorhizobium sp. LHD-90]|uniref:UDP-4-amino-4, 6-dideoxy-N-acetyl-beta-L-altrosamine transaminase n=1 Tax=Mesorhizobium sp. LHD-90 TaxID=3071414 RepID=UPI0027DFA1A1|nr:UDP-4-amino-4,6-dideoxy-N-acetyl-beta-L-altrosamine transaminase [Mesorhizobium sp. LHD-90]MDQ6437581.1 UDP-4-amino-4,6-dideoxy-N-acetyl-beta-L-altrosamine transaminase [Mesorhizobium sp. LHD-90]